MARSRVVEPVETTKTQGSGLRRRLAEKAPRTVLVPVQVTDPGDAPTRLAEAEKLLALLKLTAATAKDQDKHEKLVQEHIERVEDLQAEVAGHHDMVEFRAGHPADVEKIFADHGNDKGEWDEVGALPHLAALCAVDDELQDADWWTEQFTTIWSLGERRGLWLALVELNMSKPSENLPKG